MSFVEAIISHSSVHENEPCMLRRQSSTTFFKLTQTVNAKRFRTEKFDDFYEKHEEIGQGHFADVYRVKEKSTGTEYAAKYIKKKRLESSRRGVSKKDIQNEVNILAEMDHENIIYLHQVYENRQHVILVLELVGGGELFDFISEREWLTEEEASYFVKQILLGIKHMHSKGVAHLDLKPENVMLKGANSHELKLIDFGVSKKLSKDVEVREMLGTTEFVSPEVINFEPISLNSDMWSLGVISYIMLSGASPFLGDTQQDTYANIMACDYEFDEEFFSETSELAKDFIRKLLVKDHNKRMSVDECLVHPWIRPKSVVDEADRRQSKINMESFKMFHARRRWKQSMKVVVLCNNLQRLNWKDTDEAKTTNNNNESSVDKSIHRKSSINSVKSNCEKMESVRKTSTGDHNFVMSAIFCAINDNNITGLDNLLSMAHIDLNQTNLQGEGAVHIAAGNGQLEILKLLSSNGASLGITDARGDSGLHWAARGSHLDVMKFLVSKGVHVNLQNKFGETCLHLSCSSKSDVSIIEYLLSIHTDVNLKDNSDETAAHVAARHGCSDKILLLWKSKACLDMNNTNSVIPLDVATKNGRLECKQILLECML